MKERGDYALPLHVERRGSGPPVLLLHGFGAHSFTFRHWVAGLVDRHQVILVDLKGFGAAPKPADAAYGPGDQAELVVRLILSHDLRDLTLVGHSLGGGVALMVALRLLDRGQYWRLRGLVSVAGIAYHQDMPTYIGLARRRLLGRLILKVVPTRWLIRKVLASIVHDPGCVTRAQVEAYAEPLGTVEGRRSLVESALRLLPDDLDAIVRRYPEVDVPTLLLWGRSDPVVPLRVGERLQRELPRARLVVVEDCGHDPPEERPRETLEILLDFLASLDAPQQPEASPPPEGGPAGSKPPQESTGSGG